MQCDVFELMGDDGTPLFTRCYRPPSATDRAVVLVHGASEHGDRYTHVVRRFVERRWNVVLHDHRGHGHSGGPSMHVERFDQYADDLDLVTTCLGLVPERTAFIGHSMGGLASIRFHQLFPGRTAALVLMSPLLGLGVKVPLWKLTVGHLVRYFWPRYRFRTEVREEDTTRTPHVVARRRADRLVHNTVTANWFFETQEAIRDAWADAAMIDVPLLVLQAGADRIVDPAVVEGWLALTKSRDRTFRWFSDHFHELHHEPGWEAILDGIADWLDERLPVAEAVPAKPSFAEAVADCRRKRMTPVEPSAGSIAASVAGS